mgnify:CR=1 FL=1
MTIYVGNLPFDITDDELKAIFEAYGKVASTKIMMSQETGFTRGYGFVEMNDNIAVKAINGINGYKFKGKSLIVNEAKVKHAGYRDNRSRRPY